MSKLLWTFTTRTGGASEGPYRSFNVSLAVGDDPQRVAENRRRVVRAFGLDGPQLEVAVAVQEHGCRVLIVGGARCPLPGTSAAVWQVVGRGDALLTCRPGQAVAVLVADCAPVLVADERSGWVGAIHAGWRGLAGGVIERALATMLRLGGSEPQSLRAFIGPCIRACCYRVGPEVARAVGPGAQRRGDGWFVDVAEAARRRLVQAGVPPSRIWMDGRCTACHGELFFSYRRDGPRSGRMAGLIVRLEG